MFTYTPSGQRASATDERGVTLYTYDARQRLVRKQDPTGHRLDYSYDSVGSLIQLTATLARASVGFSTTYTYDQLNRLETISDPQARVATLTYDANGNRATLSHGNGLTTRYAYDTLNRLTQMETATVDDDVVQSYAYSLAPTGHRRRIDETNGKTRIYTYDRLYRLTQDRVTFAGAGLFYQHDFTYDPVGNRIRQTIDQGSAPTVLASTYDVRDRLQTAGFTTFSWDVHGNLTNKDSSAYGWDYDQHLTDVTLADGTRAKNVYDVDGNLVQSIVTPTGGTPVLIDYLVDTRGLLSHVVAEIVAGAAQTIYVRSDDELVSLFRPGSGETRCFHADGLGSVRALSNTAGAVTDTYEYTAFGELIAHVGADVQPYRFAGEPFDMNVGFYYNRARWLDPQSGRFTSIDPWAGSTGEPMSLHRYLYARVDPINLRDPSGENPLVALLVILAILAIIFGLLYFAFERSVPKAQQLPQISEFVRSRDAAAIQAMLGIQERCLTEGAEYCGPICVQGDRKTCQVGPPPAQRGNAGDCTDAIQPCSDPSTRTVAFYHCHGGDRGMASDEVFSIDDQFTTMMNDKPMYLITPKGRMKRYTKWTGSVDLGTANDQPQQ